MNFLQPLWTPLTITGLVLPDLRQRTDASVRTDAVISLLFLSPLGYASTVLLKKKALVPSLFTPAKQNP